MVLQCLSTSFWCLPHPRKMVVAEWYVWGGLSSHQLDLTYMSSSRFCNLYLYLDTLLLASRLCLAYSFSDIPLSFSRLHVWKWALHLWETCFPASHILCTFNYIYNETETFTNDFVQVLFRAICGHHSPGLLASPICPRAQPQSCIQITQSQSFTII